MNNFEIIIGIEIHIQLNTKTKMFSSAPNIFDAEPNTSVSPVDIAYPGTLPVLNKEAVIKAIKLAKALNMKIDNELHFDRKNYFYPDLPKGFQITQNDRPIGKNGSIPLELEEITKNVEIERIHLEEDTAKSIHKEGKTFLNYNRAGAPLIEMVTKPVIKSAKEAASYVDNVRKLALALNISNAKLEEGSMRADINISLRPWGQKEFGTKVEIKNLNSLSNIEKATLFEIKRQKQDILAGKKIYQETRRFDEASQKTVVMRRKDNALDYKYFHEANIPVIKLDRDFIDSVKTGELPWQIVDRLRKHKIDDEYVQQFSNDNQKLAFFDLIDFEDKNQLAKVFFAELVSLANKHGLEVSELNISPKAIKETLTKQKSGMISGSHIKKIFPIMFKEGLKLEQIMDKYNFKLISDIDTLEPIIVKIISDNKDFINKNKDRPERVSKFVLGLLMKATKGQANPITASSIVEKLTK